MTESIQSWAKSPLNLAYNRRVPEEPLQLQWKKTGIRGIRTA